ncbi:hypothetical protein GCM10007920_23550 [Ciceribacter naphthalenivorans]|uniref:Transmemrbane protein n=2 Tax=Alphaproteobacteria TaxID=28211 RepID=A0A512HGL9_9HYPH|nr:DUF6163 family protein [Ciceribacter naphthalenivorans]GEO84605.1 hypothetical protein RNA01_15370 [Ciceribacter naphthalenivorans]GLR22568.1 hypothetical protein GCM10007920_23550 [Ciceribacter naphthalenivorans]GLT05424.1 hypothetical protein GCM10007926_23550 [Sphingomonas psychrolutea]
MVFLRLVAVACLWFALQYWAMLVGYSLNGQSRFDLLNLPWQVAAVSLAVLFPVAALGLWMAVSWGPVIWALAAIAQILMYWVWSDIFGLNNLVVTMHAVVALVYMVFRLALWLEMRHKGEEIRVDLP